jgi:hypothetical protein
LITKIHLIKKDILYQEIKRHLLSTEFKRNYTPDLNSKIPDFYQNIFNIYDDVKKFFDDDFSEKMNNFVTSFEVFRAKQINALFKNIVDLLNVYFKLILKFKNSVSSESFRFYIDLIVKNCKAKIKRFLEEPLGYFPDACIWMLFDNEPVGVCSIKSEDIIWSPNPYKRGIISTRTVYTDIKSLNPNDFNHPELENIARIKLFANLVHTSELHELLNDTAVVQEFGLITNFPPAIISNGFYLSFFKIRRGFV